MRLPTTQGVAAAQPALPPTAGISYFHSVFPFWGSRPTTAGPVNQTMQRRPLISARSGDDQKAYFLFPSWEAVQAIFPLFFLKATNAPPLIRAGTRTKSSTTRGDAA